MKKGILVFDTGNQRLDIRFLNGSFYGGLHCGEYFDVKVNGKWIPTRIEMNEDWFLVGINSSNLVGLEVRI